MTINHLNLPVADVRQLHDFLIQHFGFTSDSITENGKFAVLTDANGFVIVSQQTDEPFPQDFHIGYFVDNADVVKQKHAELSKTSAHVTPLKDFKRSEKASLTFYCRAYGLLIEVTGQYSAA